MENARSAIKDSTLSLTGCVPIQLWGVTAQPTVFPATRINNAPDAGMAIIYRVGSANPMWLCNRIAWWDSIPGCARCVGKDMPSLFPTAAVMLPG